MTRCGQFGQQRRHYGSSDGQTSPESLTISLVAGRPLETVQKHTSTPLPAKSQWRMAVFCNKIFFLFIRYVTKPHAAPVCGPVQGFPQRLSSILGRRGHHEPTQLRYSPFFLSQKTICKYNNKASHDPAESPGSRVRSKFWANEI